MSEIQDEKAASKLEETNEGSKLDNISNWQPPSTEIVAGTNSTLPNNNGSMLGQEKG